MTEKQCPHMTANGSKCSICRECDLLRSENLELKRLLRNAVESLQEMAQRDCAPCSAYALIASRRVTLQMPRGI